MSRLLSFRGRRLSAGSLRLARPAVDHYWSREVAAQLEPLVAYTMAQSPVTVSGIGVSTDAAFFGGSLPAAATDIVIPEGSKLTIPAGDAFAFNRMFVYGALEIAGAPPPAATTVTCDTIAVMPGGRLRCVETTGARVDFIFRTETDIDIAQDPWRVSRGLVNLGDLEIVGRPRQYLLPVSHDILAGVTAQLDFTRIPFLGRDGASGDGAFNYTAWTLDWAPGEKIILPGVQPRASVAEGHKSEIVEISAFNLVENATPFSAKDTTGSSVTLSAPASLDHLKYFDQAALDAINPSFGPAPGAPTAGSHATFFGLPFALNPNRNIRFLMTTPTAPIHRRAYIGIHSPATRIAWTERQGLGRTSMLADTAAPGEGPIATDTNLRFQHSMSVYDAGHTFFDDVKQGRNCVQLIGNASWSGGAPGAAVNDIGGGSGGSAHGQFNSSVYYEANLSDNTIGAAINVLGANDMFMARHNVASCVWSEIPLNGAPPHFKDIDDYPRDDTGRDGSAYFSATRTGEWSRNLAFGYAGAGRVILSRSHAVSEQFLSVYVPEGPEQVLYQQFGGVPNDDLPRLVINGDYFAGGRDGSIISKNAPTQQHGWRTHIKDCVYLEHRRYGSLYEYTGNYHLDRNIFLGAASRELLNAGMRLDNSVYGFVCNGFFIGNQGIGVSAKKSDADDIPNTDSEVDYRFIDFEPMHGVTTDWDNITVAGGAPEVITLNNNYDGDFGFNITEIDTTSEHGAVIFKGVVRDPLGEYPYIFATPSHDQGGLRVRSFMRFGAFAVHGYYTNSGAGAPVFSYFKLVAMDRLNAGRFLEVLYPLPADSPPTLEPWTHPSGAPYVLENKGSRDFQAEFAAANAVANNGVVFT